MWQSIKVQALQHIKENLVIYLIILFSFTVGVATGSFTVGAISESQKNDLIGYFIGFFDELGQQSINVGNVFRQSFVNNIQLTVIVTVLGLSSIGIPFVLLIIGFRGFLIGFTVGFLVGEMGFKGFFIVLLGILPPNILLIPCIIIGGVFAVQNAIKNFKERQIPRSRDEKIRSTIPYITRMSVVFLTSIVGMLIESIFVPFFLRVFSGFF